MWPALAVEQHGGGCAHCSRAAHSHTELTLCRDTPDDTLCVDVLHQRSVLHHQQDHTLFTAERRTTRTARGRRRRSVTQVRCSPGLTSGRTCRHSPTLHQQQGHCCLLALALVVARAYQTYSASAKFGTLAMGRRWPAVPRAAPACPPPPVPPAASISLSTAPAHPAGCPCAPANLLWWGKPRVAWEVPGRR